MPFAGAIRHFRRYRYIFNVFARHGFSSALNLLPSEPGWLRAARSEEPATLPTHFRQALEELGPTFVKLGQMLSTRPDLLPPEYIVELSRLRDQVPPVPWPEIREVLESELGISPEEAFRFIDPQPMAAASLGQVHAATLLNGADVVVKVQRPHIQPNIRTDLEILADLAHYVDRYTPVGRIYNLEEIAQDFSDTLNSELDYRREGQNADRFQHNFANDSYIHIPEIHWEHTTRRVLVMERIYGLNINEIDRLEAEGHDRHRLANQAARLIIKEVMEDGFFHADPHPGNFMVMENGAIGVIDFGMVGYLNDQDRTNLIRLYAVTARLDAQGIVDELIHLGAAQAEVDRRALIRDLERFLRRYYGVSLQDIRAGEVLTELLPLAFRHHIRLPSNLWLLGKTLVMMEGVGLKLDPDFDIFAFSGPYATQLLLKSALPSRRWLEELVRQGSAWGDFSLTLPRVGLMLAERLERREPIPLSLDDQSLRLLDRLVTRLSLSLISAGMIIGFALLIPTTAQSNLALQMLAGLAFLGALGIGGWLVISILRGR